MVYYTMMVDGKYYTMMLKHDGLLYRKPCFNLKSKACHSFFFKEVLQNAAFDSGFTKVFLSII